jgi:hypothetical protein
MYTENKKGLERDIGATPRLAYPIDRRFISAHEQLKVLGQ